MSPRTPDNQFCPEHATNCAALARIEQKLDDLGERLVWRLVILERVVFGAIGVVCLAVGAAVLALVLR